MIDDFSIDPNATLTPVSYECIMDAAEEFQLPHTLLLGILKIEGGTVGQVSANSNGTYDIGPMQINTIWLETFENYVSLDDILYNGCTNIRVGTWILKSRILEAEENENDFWLGVGNYHSYTPERSLWYREKVYEATLSFGGP